MAASDALPRPRKNVAYRVTFPIFDADGDLVAGAAGLDSEVSKDAGTFADCTNEATEIATSSGMYYLDLTSTEMNCDCVAIIVKTSTTGAKTTPIVLYPLDDLETEVYRTWNTAIPGSPTSDSPFERLKSLDDDTTLLPALVSALSMRSGTAQAGDATHITLDASASAVDDFYNGATIELTGGTGAGQSKVIADYVGSTKVALVTTWITNPSSSTTFRIISSGSGLDAAATRAAVGLATASLDTQFAAGLSKLLKYVQLLARKDAAIATDNATELAAINATGGSGAGAYVNTTDAHEALRDNMGTAQTGDSYARLGAPAGASVSADVAAVKADTANAQRTVARGTATGGSTTTMVDAARAEADTNYWKGMLLVPTSGNIAGQGRVITAFNAATDTITFSPALTQAFSNQTYEIRAEGDFLRPATSGQTAAINGAGEILVDWNPAEEVIANVKKMNDITLDGDGTAGDPMRAA